MKTFYTADLHIEHDMIINHCKRPFKDGFEMNEILIRNINAKCGYDDILYHLGDFYMATGASYDKGHVYPIEHYLDEIKPTIVHILGNHDNRRALKTGVEEAVVRIGKKTKVFMSHHPQTVLPINLCGHVHDTWRIHYTNNMFVINCGVDVWNFEPIEWHDLQKVMGNHRDFYSGKAEKRPVINERVWREHLDE